MSVLSVIDGQRTVAPLGCSRWLLPAEAAARQLSSMSTTRRWIEVSQVLPNRVARFTCHDGRSTHCHRLDAQRSVSRLRCEINEAPTRGRALLGNGR
jgi:hypothetical protein